MILWYGILNSSWAGIIINIDISRSLNWKYVVLQVVLPPANTVQAKAAYQKMQHEFDFNPRISLGV